LRKTKKGIYLSQKEWENIESSEEINRRIARGEKILSSIYKSIDYTPKVEILFINWQNCAVVKILEGKLKGQIESYYYSNKIKELKEGEDDSE